MSVTPLPSEPGQCACGAGLWWETRETPKGKRWLALCLSPECGVITTSVHDAEPESALETFLSGDDRPPEREAVYEWDFNG
jgi:hypothetical protein